MRRSLQTSHREEGEGGGGAGEEGNNYSLNPVLFFFFFRLIIRLPTKMGFHQFDTITRSCFTFVATEMPQISEAQQRTRSWPRIFKVKGWIIGLFVQPSTWRRTEQSRKVKCFLFCRTPTLSEVLTGGSVCKHPWLILMLHHFLSVAL